MQRKGIIALDLDGTLLNTAKELTPRTLRALTDAAQAGWEIVPTTGRFFSAMPELDCIRGLLRYAITINGAQVLEIATGRVLYRAELPTERAIAILDRLQPEDLIYDCYVDNWGWVPRDMQARCADYVPNQFYYTMVSQYRTAVDDLRAFLREQGKPVQKIQFFSHDMAMRERMLNDLEKEFEHIAVSSSAPNNLEINDAGASKGQALAALAKALEVPIENTVAFGDGTNDLSMIHTAGLGVAMANAHPDVLAVADEVTLSCNEDGVAVRIERLLKEGK